MSGEKKGFVIEPHSPHYLHTTEGPGVLVTTVIFHKMNFDLWEIAISTALKAKKQTRVHRRNPKASRRDSR